MGIQNQYPVHFFLRLLALSRLDVERLKKQWEPPCFCFSLLLESGNKRALLCFCPFFTVITVIISSFCSESIIFFSRR